ncbi:ATP binding cassette (ABC) transporter subfamily B member, partial [Diabrotica virgifera virgifera]
STIRGANKIIVLSQGVVVEEGTHEELMELKQEYYRLVTAQVKSSEQFEVAEKKKVVRAISLAESSTGSDHNIEATKEDNEDDFNENKDVSVFEILKMNAPEWPYILFAGLGSIVVGCGMPVFAVLFGSILGTLANGDPDFVRSETNKYCLYFVLGGLITMVSVFTQMYLLGIAGEKMTERVRSRLFKAMIYQEIGFFDKKTNGVGALCAKLSSDASNIQGVSIAN